MINKILNNQIIIIFLAFALFSCKNNEPKITRAFYYWKSSGDSLSNKEESFLKKNNIQKLYVKFFEVDKDSIRGLIPVAKSGLYIRNLTCRDSSGEISGIEKPEGIDIEIIPTIFIKNKILFSCSDVSLDSLAVNIVFLISKHFRDHMGKCKFHFYNEIQLDCDWTERTKIKYFHLLKKIKNISGKTISCTIRLYPFRYSEKMGIPPVDKAVLMCYNLINPFESEEKNSILPLDELKNYLKNAKPYPLHLDFALPLFSWMQVYQNNHFAGLIGPKPHELDSFLKPIKPLWFVVTRDKEFENLFLRQGDKIKFEDISAKNIIEAISLLKKYNYRDNQSNLIFFHLDENIINTFNDEAIYNFFIDFNN